MFVIHLLYSILHLAKSIFILSENIPRVPFYSDWITQVAETPSLLDVSELLRPEEQLKEKESFRDYNKDDEVGERVRRTYYEMHTNQTIEFVRAQHKKWLKFDHMEATVMEALEMLNELVDESDPDTDLPNIGEIFLKFPI